MGQYFRHLRKIPWIPEFKWVSTVEEAADTINRPYEDYPNRVFDTQEAIEYGLEIEGKFEVSISELNLCSIHHWVFHNTLHAGNYRNFNVRVGDHICPHPSVLEGLMSDLVLIHTPFIQDIETSSRFNKILGAKEVLTDWYSDFETIHPFEDGNGRVGGIIVALFSHKWFPENGYLVPCQ